MNKLLKVQSKGVITIPKEIREVLGLEEGDFLEISFKNEKIILEPIQVINKELQEKVFKQLNKK
ncbi:MAG: AbrB/MazE/SpoVT family DNA-binding domain-containing protein [Candidatus Pacebacteria bacterium]|nr:AbrB/MazE/SpoVT family DNA-binding domain-containing protein [Candidatus Paceibacterota bacterium]